MNIEDLTKIILNHDGMYLSERGTYWYANVLARRMYNIMYGDITKDWNDQMIQDVGLNDENTSTEC